MKQAKKSFNRCATCKFFERGKENKKIRKCKNNDYAEYWLANGRACLHYKPR